MKKRRAEAAWLEGTKRWRISVQKYGKRKSFYSSVKGRKGKHEAEAAADRWLEEGTDAQLFEQAWKLFMDAKKESGVSVTTLNKYGVTYRNHLITTIGPRRLSAITPALWQKVIDTAASNGLGAASCKGLRTTIYSFMRFCRLSRFEHIRLEDGDLRMPVGLKQPKEKAILQPDDIRTLFQDETGEQSIYLYAWRFMVATGLRRGELIGLRKEDITDTTITICRAINTLGQETHGKNANAQRQFRITPLVRKILDDQQKMLTSRGIVSPWVFCNTVGHHIDWSHLGTHWRRYRAEHGMTATLHGLRHTFISLGKDDMPIQLMKSVVGHSASMDTYGVYGHHVQGEQERAAQIIEGIFEDILKQKTSGA